ncbi:Degradation activator [Actinomyces slackii]|uniref:Degradation activator n=3 Tax=Actinomyces slackii TaxID=52774 RepID=A0A448KET1_9ACTO|nr:Degradation activator [Actinomyces slackii]
MSRAGEGHRVTMREVAQRAGVSVTTVSHVVNHKTEARIGPEARERVRQAVEELGYRPNALAKTLVQGTSPFIGLVADSIASTPFAGQIVHGAQEEAWRHGHVLLVTNTEGNQEAEERAIAMMLQYNVRGILYSRWYHREVEVPPALGETDSVLVNCYGRVGAGPAAVVPDEVDGGRRAAEILLRRGHRRIAFINTTTASPARSGRLQGYRQALAGAGIPVDEDLILEARPDQEGGYGIADDLLATGATGVCCHNDRMAMGLYDTIKERGLSIPQDLSVVGFDNQEVIAGHLHPSLSTVALPHYEMGAAGVRVLLGLQEVPAGGILTVPCPPVERDSVDGAAAPPTG